MKNFRLSFLLTSLVVAFMFVGLLLVSAFGYSEKIVNAFAYSNEAVIENGVNVTTPIFIEEAVIENGVNITMPIFIEEAVIENGVNVTMPIFIEN